MYDIYTPRPAEMTIFIFDQQVRLLGVMDHFTSLVMERSLFGVGSFTLTCAQGTAGAEMLRCGNLVCLGKSDSRVGLIRQRKIEDGKTRTVTVTGPMLKGLMAQRIIVPPTETEVPGSYGWESIDSTEAENVLRHYVTYSATGPRDANRTIPGFVLDDLHDPPRGPVTPWFATIKEKLVDVLQAIGDWTEYGWDIRLDIKNARMVFVIIPMRDKTRGSGSSIIFSRDIENLGEYTYTENRQDYQNSLYLGGAGQDEEQLILTEYVDDEGQPVDDAFAGRERFEGWTAAGNISDPEKLIYEGLHRFNQRRKAVETVTAEVYDVDPFRYGVNWDLGDKVTVQISIDGEQRRLDTQITNVTEAYENGIIRIVPTFGTDALTLKQRIQMLEAQEG